ncbi:MAG: bifunctional metallophosphatase/5'-nucleotidase [Prevotella sp.]
MKHLVANLFAVLTLTACTTNDAPIITPDTSTVVLFENDVHCQVEGYTSLSQLRDAIRDTAHVAVVSSGDFLQGGIVGVISRGAHITAIMQTIGYDAITLGNHEFDYQIDRMTQLIDQAGLPITSCNFIALPDSIHPTSRHPYPSYIIRTIGKHKIAFIGITTPTTLQNEEYAFWDNQGHQTHDLLTDYQIVQDAADQARSQGAQYCIVLSHLGEEDNNMHITSHTLAAATYGIDAILDGHSHSVIPCYQHTNLHGKPVIIAQTGTGFQNIGKLTIDTQGRITTELLPTASLPETVKSRHTQTATAVDSIKALVARETSQVVCHSDFPIRILDDEGRQAIRFSETNAGDLVCDAFRTISNAQIALCNGGGIRTDLPSGDLTYGDVISLLPFEDDLEVIQVTGQELYDALEACSQLCPESDGQFAQVSGIRYTIDTHSAKRITSIDLLNPDSTYTPIAPQQTYTLCTRNYCTTGGGIYGKFKQCPKLKTEICRYGDALIEYITEYLGGEIPPQYAQPQGRIKII